MLSVVHVASQYRDVSRLSPAVSCGNDLYNTNSPSASVVTVVRYHLYTCASVTFTSHGYYSRAAFISFKSFRSCGNYSRAASILINMVSRKNSNLLCHNCPTHLSYKCTTHLSHKCSTYLSHESPIPISQYVYFHTLYRRNGFNRENLIIANCEFF